MWRFDAGSANLVVVLPRPLLIDLYPRGIDSGELDKRFPPHRLFLEPLLEVALEVSVRGRGVGDRPPVPPGTRKGGILYLDLQRELVKGWEWFWNAGSWGRGAVLIKVPRSKVDWAELFHWTQYVGTWRSRGQIAKGTPRGAITYADEAGRGEHVVVSLSASNGIQWADIWSDPAVCGELDELARACCRRFVRWVEHGKFEREIIYDREPYIGLV